MLSNRFLPFFFFSFDAHRILINVNTEYFLTQSPLCYHRESLMAQLEASLTKADTEQLARSIVEEQYSDLEKEKIIKELEIKDMMARHKQELGDKEATISSVRGTDGVFPQLMKKEQQCWFHAWA